MTQINAGRMRDAELALLLASRNGLPRFVARPGDREMLLWLSQVAATEEFQELRARTGLPVNGSAEEREKLLKLIKKYGMRTDVDDLL